MSANKEFPEMAENQSKQWLKNSRKQMCILRINLIKD